MTTKPNGYYAFLRILDFEHYTANLTTLIKFSPYTDRNNPAHGPTYAEIRVKRAHLSARSFHPYQQPDRPYTPQLHSLGHAPKRNYIYIALPNGAVYASVVENYEPHHRPA